MQNVSEQIRAYQAKQRDNFQQIDALMARSEREGRALETAYLQATVSLA